MTTVKRGEVLQRGHIVDSRPSVYGGDTSYPEPPGTTIPNAEYEDDAGSCYWCGFTLESIGIASCPHCGSDNVQGVKLSDI